MSLKTNKISSETIEKVSNIYLKYYKIVRDPWCLHTQIISKKTLGIYRMQVSETKFVCLLQPHVKTFERIQTGLSLFKRVLLN